MNICGLQKLALVDYPGKLAATVFTGGCNLRCPFCHNAQLVTGAADARAHYTQENILAFLSTRRNLLDGVVISGGEPLMQDGVGEFAAAAKAMGFSVKLDTNGCYPEKLRALLEAGMVDYVAMDIKNSLPKYPPTVGVPGFGAEAVRESAALLMAGSTPYEFRTTLVREFHTVADLLAIGHWLEGGARYYLQSFVDSGGLIQSGLHGFSPGEMQGFLDAVRPFFCQAALRGVA